MRGTHQQYAGWWLSRQFPKNMKVDWEHHLKLFLKLGHELGEKKTLALMSLAN